ncbi:hypothetical protein HO173_008236 [Letharia columbiana]|uniref:Exosome complex protein n=1 Tax=Letharia columbiana TaxID=112416 RepID=A0A8H6FS03_9LECA|nr:uncharacterized protein HO173_008236 [Letharia columbiana]KAF6233679.1 hypothetical protein HO173_008236 [Letharia columbiana]
MEAIDLVPLIKSLDDNIDDLEEALEPLLKSAVSDTAGKLPLLDKAQLYVLVTYAIESILFSYLRLNGVNSKEHPVFRELTRVKHYFEKIKAAESAETRQNVTLDKAAAGRFIKNALAGNKRFDLDLAKQSKKESAATHTRFERFPKKQKFSSDPGNGSRAVSSSDDPNTDTEHLESSEGPRLKRMKVQSINDRRESEDGTKTRTKHELNPSSGKASKIDPTNGDSKAEEQEQEQEQIEQEEGMQDGD